jgi:hypothetical protein
MIYVATVKLTLEAISKLTYCSSSVKTLIALVAEKKIPINYFVKYKSNDDYLP